VADLPVPFTARIIGFYGLSGEPPTPIPLLDILAGEEYPVSCALDSSHLCWVRPIQTKETFMSSSVHSIPEGYHSLTPQLTCRDAARAIDFYKSIFGATEVMRMASPDGKIMHAELKIGDSHLMVNDEFPGVTVAPNPSAIHSSSLFFYLEEVDSVYNRAVAAGSRIDMPLDNMFWGDRYGKITDPFGHQWGLAKHVEDVAPEEMKRRSAEAMAKMAKAAGAGQT
jgi:PhnB protein